MVVMKMRTGVLGIALVLTLGVGVGVYVQGLGDRSPARVVVLQRVTDLGELRLARHEYSQSAVWDSARKAADWAAVIPGADEVVGALTRNQAVGEVTGHVDAGIDFSRATIAIEGKTVQVCLPAPRVLDTVVDANPVHHKPGLLWRNNDMASVAEAEYSGVLRSSAVRGGILERARTNAESVVRGLFDSREWNVEVRFSQKAV